MLNRVEIVQTQSLQDIYKSLISVRLPQACRSLAGADSGGRKRSREHSKEQPHVVCTMSGDGRVDFMDDLSLSAQCDAAVGSTEAESSCKHEGRTSIDTPIVTPFTRRLPQPKDAIWISDHDELYISSWVAVPI